MNYLILATKISLIISLINMAINIIDFTINQRHEYKDNLLQIISLGFIPIINILMLFATLDDLIFGDDEDDDIWNKQS